jgi:hypothetical protein
MAKRRYKAKYNNADDLLDNCTISDTGCYLWPESSCQMPMMASQSPLAMKFTSVSIVRILFTICRFVPAGPRLISVCNSKWCVNPYHHTESKRFRIKRFATGQPNDLLPEQESSRHLIAPSDEELTEMRPKKPIHIKTLLDSAVVAGYDAEGITNKRVLMTPPRKPVRMASEDGPPILTIKLREEPKPEVPKDDTPLESWEDIEFGIDKMIAHISAQRKAKMERNSE